MPLDATAAAAAAEIVVTTTLDPYLVGLDPARLAAFRAQAIASYTTLIAAIYAGIVANAIVSPLGIPPMANSGGAVGGTGKIL